MHGRRAEQQPGMAGRLDHECTVALARGDHGLARPLGQERRQPALSDSTMKYLDLIQWPAMALTAIAAWLVASQSKRKRRVGFWTFLSSNVFWVVWGLHDHAHALVALQVALAALNVRGGYKNEPNAGPAR